MYTEKVRITCDTALRGSPLAIAERLSSVMERVRSMTGIAHAGMDPVTSQGQFQVNVPAKVSGLKASYDLLVTASVETLDTRPVLELSVEGPKTAVEAFLRHFDKFADELEPP